jgi:hypothetical protein
LVDKKIESAAELSQEVRPLGIKTRREYFAAAVLYPHLPLKPESFRDWPTRIDAFTEKEAWQILFGIFDEDRINAGCKNIVYQKSMFRKAENARRAVR